MRLAIIHPFLFRYSRGIERYTVCLANAFAQRGVEVHLLTWRWQQPVPLETLQPGVTIHVFPTSRYFAASLMMPLYASHLVRYRYDWVLIYFAGYGEALPLTLARALGQKYAIVFHYPRVQVPHRYNEFAPFDLARRANKIFGMSRFVAEGVQEAFGRSSSVIPPGVDTQRFAPNASARAEWRKELGVSPTAPIVLTVAALELRKGIQYVLRVLPDVLEKFPDAEYWVVGDGPDRAELQQLTASPDLRGPIRWFGARADTERFYQAADLSVILSHGEASSATLLESLASGLPVIAADVRPFDELAIEGTVVLLDRENERALAQTIVQLLDSPQRRHAMGAVGRRAMQQNFKWQNVAEQMLEILNAPQNPIA